ncbi:hypothetical protein [Sulfurimonas indica]|uniref:hypothetical protein n=1 Tax=Sulfurimonas TaxID=202746 RepID=UPI001263F0E5|nr:hypothetical protein [Sulfurimonas indica]
MEIFRDGEAIIQTKRREDFRLFSKLDIEYANQDLEKIVNVVYANRNIDLNYVFDLLYFHGYDLINENDIDQVMIWLKQIFSQYKKEF